MRKLSYFLVYFRILSYFRIFVRTRSKKKAYALRERKKSMKFLIILLLLLFSVRTCVHTQNPQINFNCVWFPSNGAHRFIHLAYYGPLLFSFPATLNEDSLRLQLNRMHFPFPLTNIYLCNVQISNSFGCLFCVMTYSFAITALI